MDLLLPFTTLEQKVSNTESSSNPERMESARKEHGKSKVRPGCFALLAGSTGAPESRRPKRTAALVSQEVFSLEWGVISRQGGHPSGRPTA